MGVIENIQAFAKSKVKEWISEAPAKPMAYGNLVNSWTVGFDGEKSLGEIGPAYNLKPNYQVLRIRAWQSYLENELTKTIIDKFVLWIVSGGLKIQANPNKETLKTEGITFNKEVFNEVIEARFATWAKSAQSSYSGIGNLHTLSKYVEKEGLIGGDALVVMRVEKGLPNIQIIDGAHVRNPSDGYSGGMDFGLFDNQYKLENGNTVTHGIERNAKGEHIAFHVRDNFNKYQRIKAKNSQGLTVAWMYYVDQYRLDGVRGIPKFSNSLETLAKLDRYKEAVVASAEERAKIVYTIEHSRDSTGEDPRAAQTVKALKYSAGYNTDDSDPVDINGVQLANNIAATTNKETYNMPIGAQLKSLESTIELSFKEFWETNADAVCATIGIAPNVAFSKYNDSFSASRAATKDWEHTIVTSREYMLCYFFQPIYNMFLHLQVLQNKVQATGYMRAFMDGNVMAIEAYRNCRITGPMFPHIDPVKEVTAERMKLGGLGQNIPLTNAEQATEVVNGGDSDSNAEQFAAELKAFEGLVPPVQTI